MNPATIHAAKTSWIEPTVRAMSLVTRKMPVPIVSLMTTAVAARNVKPRTSPPECECCESPCESGVGEAMERSEDYYRAQPRSMRVAVTSIEKQPARCRRYRPHRRPLQLQQTAVYRYDQAMSHKMMISEYALDPAYVVKNFDDILTPALLV